jgi:glycine dehydrogenase subunit 1
MGWLGPEGLREVGDQSAQKAHYLADQLAQLPGVEPVTTARFVREFAVNLPMDADEVIAAMAERGYLAGISLGGDYPTMPNGILVAVTEKRSRAELDGYVAALKEVLTHG